MNWHVRILAGLALALLLLPARPLPARAHCDTMDGPVVKAARLALDHNDVRLVLLWVKPADEAAIRDAFRRTIAVRKLGPDAKDLADHWFFETLVRTHRAGEGAPYTGLKPAGTSVGPAVELADQALETGDAGPLTSLIMEAVRKNLHDRFRATMAAKRYQAADVSAGRDYVECYIAFIHQAEAIYEAATRPPEGHYDEEAAEVPAPSGQHR